MFRAAIRSLVGVSVLALALGSSTISSGASTRTAAQGVTDDEILVVVIVPDLDELRRRGINLPAKLTTGAFLKRFAGHADAFGKVNGRTVVSKAVGWDPTDATSFEKACIVATQDNKPFVVVNGSGYRASSISCITIDNRTPFISGDMSTAAFQKASGKNLLTLGVPGDALAKAAAELMAKNQVIPKSAKIGILSNNEPGVKASGDTLEAELKKRGFSVVEKVELNGLAADATAINRESSAAVATLKAKGVDTVFNVNSWTPLAGFFEEMGRTDAGFKVFAIDGQANTCTMNAAGRTPREAVGAVCVTTYDTRALPTKDGVKPDTDFEAECRAEFDEFMNEKSTPGAPNGDVTVNGVTYVEDLSPFECTIAKFLLPAIKKAGKNPTWDKVYANLVKTTKAPAAYMSNGEGGFGTKKPYFATQVHLVELVRADASTPKGADGTYNGCPVPVNCFVPILVDGQEWFPVSSK